MATLAVKKQSDLGMFWISFVVAIVVFGLSFLALRYATPAAPSEVPLVPCRQCNVCVCPRLAGASLCGCPR